jgi:copper chaperone CopZ
MDSTRLTLPLAGLGCAAGEAQTIEHVLRETPGVASVYLNPVNDTAYIEYDSGITDPFRLRSAMRAAGFRPSEGMADRRTAGRPAGSQLEGARTALAGGIWLLLVYSACIAALTMLGYAPGAGMYAFWGSFLIGFDGASARGILLGFAEAFIYGAAGAWLFTAIYNQVPGRSQSARES